jgi:hypothetical protein
MYDLLFCLIACISLRNPWVSLGPQEGQQVGVELLLVRAGEDVRRTRIDLKARVLDELGGEQGGVADRHDLVIVAMNDQREKALMQSFSPSLLTG